MKNFIKNREIKEDTKDNGIYNHSQYQRVPTTPTIKMNKKNKRSGDYLINPLEVPTTNKVDCKD